MTSQVEERVKEAVAERNALAAAFKSGVTEDGLKLFLNLSKTIGRDVTWKGSGIIVNSTVVIKPPYRSDNCCFATDSARNDKTLAYVQQLVSRFWTDSTSKQSSLRPSPEKQVSPQPTAAAASTTVPPTAAAAASVVAASGTANKQKQQQQQPNQANGSGDNVPPTKSVKATGQPTVPQGKKGSRSGS